MFVSQDLLSTWIGRKLAAKYLNQHVVCNTKQALNSTNPDKEKCFNSCHDCNTSGVVPIWPFSREKFTLLVLQPLALYIFCIVLLVTCYFLHTISVLLFNCSRWSFALCRGQQTESVVLS